MNSKDITCRNCGQDARAHDDDACKAIWPQDALPSFDPEHKRFQVMVGRTVEKIVVTRETSTETHYIKGLKPQYAESIGQKIVVHFTDGTEVQI